jgi:predicted Zn-dependent protease
MSAARVAQFWFVLTLYAPLARPFQAAPPSSAQNAAPFMSAVDRSSLQRALAAYDAGRPEEALPLLRQIAARYPQDFEAAEALGLIYAEAGKVPAALPLLERASKLRPSMAAAWANLGAAYLKLNRDQEAVRALKRSAALEPKNSQTQSNLGQALMESRHPAEAANAFAAAAAGDPRNADLLYNWALALFEAGRLQPAGEILAGLPGKETSAPAQSLWADVLEKQGNYKAAAEHFQAAVDLDSSEPNLNALGLEFMRHWTFDAAIKVYEYGVSKYPASVRMKFGLGVAKYGKNDFQGAAPVFSQLLAADPGNAMYADLLGRSCSLVAEPRGTGCDQLAQFAEQHPQNAEAATFAAASILRRPEGEEDFALAQHLLDQAIHSDPKLADAYLQLGILDGQQQRWQQSATALEKAIALRPEFAQAHYRLARAYMRLGKRDQAQREIALQQKYSAQEKDNLNARLKEVTTFLVTMQ